MGHFIWVLLLTPVECVGVGRSNQNELPLGMRGTFEVSVGSRRTSIPAKGVRQLRASTRAVRPLNRWWLWTRSYGDYNINTIDPKYPYYPKG